MYFHDLRNLVQHLPDRRSAPGRGSASGRRSFIRWTGWPDVTDERGLFKVFQNFT